MRKRQRVGLFTALALATVGTLTIAGGAANAQDSKASHGWPPNKEEANKRVVQAFMKDVLDGHRGDHASRYLTSDMSWHSGTVGTVSGLDNVTGLMTTIVTSIPDLHADVKDIFAEGDKVVVRLVVTGTQKGPLLGIPTSGKALRWDAIDLYHLKNGKISEEWAGEDYVAFLNSTGTYKAPWIP